MAFLIGGANSAADTGFDVDNSCRFNPGDNPELSRSTGDGNEDVGSFSFWWKTAKAPGGAIFYSIYVDSSNFFTISVDGGGNFQVLNKLSGSYNMQFESTATFRDPSAWYNFVVLVDTTQAVEANRMKAYVNGTQITSWQTDTYPSQNTDMIMNSNSRTAYISQSGDRMHGYLAEFVLIDGTAKVVGDFGEYDEDSPTIWKPKDVSGLSGDKGVNGFYLDFEDSSALGNCAFGGTDFTVSNLAAADQATDTPTNNFCTLNPLNKTDLTFSQGNCKLVCSTTASAHRMYKATFGLTAGKWYWEVKPVHIGSNFGNLGIIDDAGYDEDDYLGNETYGYSYRPDGKKYNAGSGTTYGDTWTDDDVIGVALNMDDDEIKFYKNGTVQNSDTAISISATPTTYMPAGSMIKDSTNPDYEYNFGGCSAFAISSAASDANGYGNFEYAPPSGFYAICTKNLAEYG